MSAASSSSTNLMVGEEANGGVTVLPGVEDKYGGVVTEISHTMDPSAFSSLLRTSLSNWTLQVLSLLHLLLDCFDGRNGQEIFHNRRFPFPGS